MTTAYLRAAAAVPLQLRNQTPYLSRRFLQILNYFIPRRDTSFGNYTRRNQYRNIAMCRSLPQSETSPMEGNDGNSTTGTSERASFSGTEWSTPGPAAYDFRSDFVTTPNRAMLESIVYTSLLDDETMSDPTTNSFQAWMAQLTGHEASLLVVSGTMGNQVSLRTALNTSPPYSILCDHRSHILRMEAGGPATLCGALINGITPYNGHHLTLKDAKQHITLQDSVYDCPTRVISLENTLSGTILPLEDARAISQFAHAQNPPIHMHLDGARLWEAASAGFGSLQEYAQCFDSVTLCFTKGLGAPLGSIIVGSTAFIQRARVTRKLLGGGLRQAGVIAAPARVAVEQNFLCGELRAAQRVARRISGAWVALGGKLECPTETNMVWLNLEAAGVPGDEFADLAEKVGLRTFRGRLQGRLVVHYQICDEAVELLLALFSDILEKPKEEVVIAELP